MAGGLPVAAGPQCDESEAMKCVGLRQPVAGAASDPESVGVHGVLRARLRDALPDAMSCVIYLRRLEPPVFKLPPAQLDAIVQRFTTAVATGQHTSITFPEAALVAEMVPGMGVGPEVSVPAEMPHDWDAHWRAAARELTETIRGKAAKT